MIIVRDYCPKAKLLPLSTLYATGNYHSQVIRRMAKQVETTAGESRQRANRLIHPFQESIAKKQKHNQRRRNLR
jgi:hypothetical protein